MTNLFRGKKALDTARMATERFQNTMLEGARNAQQEVVKLNLLYRAATDNARATDDRREAVRKLKEEFSGYFKNLSDEQIMLGQANDTYKELIKNIYKYAKAQAAFKSLVDIEQQELFFNNIPDIEQFLKANDKYLEAQRMLLKNGKPTMRNHGVNQAMIPKHAKISYRRKTFCQMQKKVFLTGRKGFLKRSGRTKEEKRLSMR